MKIGILALQGATGLHATLLTRLGAAVAEVRTADELADVDALVLPGGESTTISKLADANALFDPLRARLAAGMPALGTCAGMIMLASDVLDGAAGQRCLAAIDVDVRRNGFGRQVDSFETDLTLSGLGDAPMHAVFIRAPVVERVGASVEVLARIDGRPVACRDGSVVVSSFHPELGDDLRLHELFCSIVEGGLQRGVERGLEEVVGAAVESPG